MTIMMNLYGVCVKVRNIKNSKKLSIINSIKFDLFFHYLPQIFTKKIKFKEYRIIKKRVSVLLKTLKLNKFYKVGKLINIDYRIPSWKTPLFYKYIDRFSVVEEKIPCSTVLLSITKDCTFKCKHCYQLHDSGEDLDINLLNKTALELIDLGITKFIIEGGDPFIKFDRLISLCSVIGNSAEVVINSTGNGITLERLKTLKSKCNLKTITFSLNSPIVEDVNFFMGQDYAWNTLKHGLKLCSIADVSVSLNCCLHSGHFENGNFDYLMEIAKDFNVNHIMIIQPKAAGAWLEGHFIDSSEEEREIIKSFVKKYNKNRKYLKYPAITAQVVEEDEEHYGCAGGGTERFYINAKGDVQPCEFLNISFGNVKEESFSDIYSRMRDVFKTPGTNWLCDKYSSSVNDNFKLSGSLPLNFNKSKMLYSKWDRGDATPLFYKIEKELLN